MEVSMKRMVPMAVALVLLAPALAHAEITEIKQSIFGMD
jgi:hypothetical protein